MLVPGANLLRHRAYMLGPRRRVKRDTRPEIRTMLRCSSGGGSIPTRRLGFSYLRPQVPRLRGLCATAARTDLASPRDPGSALRP